MNSTVTLESAAAATCATPWYYSSAPALVPGLSDAALALLAPLVAYWGLSTLFAFLDAQDWPALARHRIHDSAEVASKNRATKAEVLRAVIFQQVIQTALGAWWMADEAAHQLVRAEHCARAAAWQAPLAALLAPVLGAPAAHALAADGAYYVYWWAVPVFQFAFAMFIIDTWQYFLHRAMHVNKFLYKHLHSVHHRLYVPYAYGALYNHPLEGFLLDTLGAAIAESAAGLSVRQAALLFGVSSLKTVDDHCGYSLPWDPLQWFSQNTADYHDIHHQIIGIKSNFSQPFYVHWDALLGTRMTREDIAARRAGVKAKKAKAE